MSRRRCGGKLFHRRGPAALKLRSLKLLCVRGTRHVLAAAERSWRRSLSVTSWMSSAMYAGVWPARAWCTRHATLCSSRWRTGSQCSWRSIGVIMVASSSSCDQTCGGVLNGLNLPLKDVWHAVQHGFAVVQTTADKRLDCCFGGGGCHWSNAEYRDKSIKSSKSNNTQLSGITRDFGARGGSNKLSGRPP